MRLDLRLVFGSLVAAGIITGTTLGSVGCGDDSPAINNTATCTGDCQCSGDTCTCAQGGKCTFGPAGAGTGAGGDGGGTLADGGAALPNDVTYKCDSKGT